MGILEGKMRMNEKVVLYIPSTVDVNVEADTEVYVNEAMEILSSLFGGATIENAIGGWLSDTHGLVKESVTKAYAYADEITEEKLVRVVQFAETMKEELSQDAVGLEINGSFYLI